MYSSTFIFAKKQYDDDFHRLDQQIADAAKAIPGYLGEESWENTSTGLISNVYYWDTLASLQLLMEMPQHKEAKARNKEWLANYQVVIAEVIRTYGDLPPTWTTPAPASPHPDPATSCPAGQN